jgi:hypothetical protein
MLPRAVAGENNRPVDQIDIPDLVRSLDARSYLRVAVSP